MADFKKFIYVSNAGGTVDGTAYASESEKFEQILSQASTASGKWYKSIIFRAATGEIYNRGSKFGVSADLNKEITDLKSLQTALVNGGLVTETGEAGSKAYVWNLEATEVAYATTVGEGDDAVSDKIIENATDVQGAIKELDAAIYGINQANLTYKTVKLTAEEVADLNDENVKEAYKVVSVDIDGKDTQVGDTIKIYKDSSLIEVDFVDTKPAETEGGEATAGQFLKYTYILANGKEDIVYVDMSTLIEQSEVENGIQNNSGKLSIKIDTEGNETDGAETPNAFLTVDAKGLKISGIKDEIAREIEATTLYEVEGSEFIAVTEKDENKQTISAKTKALGDAVGMTKGGDGKWTAADGTVTEDGLVTAADVAAEIVADELVIATALNDFQTRITDLENADAVTTTVQEKEEGQYVTVEDVKDENSNDPIYEIGVTKAVYDKTAEGLFTTAGLVDSATLKSVIDDILDVWEEI